MKITAPLAAAIVFGCGTAVAFDSAVVINEIHYAPGAGQTEFVELHNLNAVDVHLRDWKLAGGIDYTFGDLVIPGNGYLVVAANPQLIPGITPPALGPFEGSLDNAGETVRILNQNGRIMDEVEYDDENDWPVGADGSGASLSRKLPTATPGADQWTTSTNFGGTPGGQNFALNVPAHRTLITNRETWKYRDDAAAPPANWNATAFNDAAWPQGGATLGTPGGAVTLTVLTDLVERFRASDIAGLAEGATVATWTDTATGDSVSQNAAATGTTPTFRANTTPTGKATVRFDGNDQSRTTQPAGISPTGGFVYFIVLKAGGTLPSGGTADGNGAYLFDRHLTGAGNPLVSLKASNGRYGLQKRYDDGSGLGGPVSTTAISTTNYQIVAVRRNRTQGRFELWVDGVMEGQDADGGAALTPDPINIGRHATNVTGNFVGNIAEVLVYKSGLSDADFQAVGSYLESEYGLDTAYPGGLVATPLSAAAPTSYLRKTFNYPGDPARTSLRLFHTMADGAVFYLNGQELRRENMPAGAIGHTTAASSVITVPSGSAAIPVSSTALVNGTNVLAVSLHKGAGSPGVLFDAGLEATEQPPDPAAATQLRFSEIAAGGGEDFALELQNGSGAPVNTAGWTVVSSTGKKVAVPPQQLAAGGYLVLNAQALGFIPADGDKLFLIGPGGNQLKDAHVVTARPRGLTADGRWGHPSVATPGAPNQSVLNTAVVINEIFYHAPGDSPEQWIELHNKSGAAVDIGGWKFSDGITYEFPPGTVITAGGFLVVSWDPAAFAALHPGVTPLGPWDGNLSGKGELLTLRDAVDNVADQLRYSENGRWSEWADGGGSSLELIDPDADNGVGESWAASDESGLSTWETVTYNGLATNPAGGDPTTWHEFVFGLLDSGEFLIDDISVTFGASATQLIQNRDFSDGTAAFWRIIGNHAGTVVDDPLSPGNKVLKVVAGGTTEHMHNHATTSLKAGAVFHTISPSQNYTISFRAKWLRGSNRLHTRLYTNRLARQTLLNRPATGGTPGAVNRSRVANAGPAFDLLSHAPVVPSATEAAVVSIAVTDPDGVASVQLFTAVNGAAFTSVPMTAGDGGLYKGTVPGQAAASRVQFYVRATDSQGAVSTFPAAGPASRAMIPWQDGKAIAQTPGGGRPHNIRIVMPGADANGMYKLENVMSNASLPCTIIMDDREVYYRAGVRLKSSEHGRYNAARVGFNLQFPTDNLFFGAHSGVSLDRSGGIAGGQNEMLIKRVSNSARGIHAPEDDIARVIAPVATGTGYAYSGETLTGPTILSKTRFDDAYLDGQWEDGGDGPVFKYERVYVLTQTINPVTRVVDPAIVRENPKIPQDSTGPPGVNVTSLGTLAQKENYRWYWLIENARAQDDYEKIINLATAIGRAAGSAQFKTETAQYMDVSTYLRGHLPANLFGVTDNYLTGAAQHNVMFYFPPGGKAVMLPWDLDFLAQGSTTASLVAGQDLPKFLTDGVNRRLYYGHLLDVLNRSFNDAFLTRWATHYSTFGTEDMTAALTYLRGRATYARNLLSGATPPVSRQPFSITTVPPSPVTTPFLTLTGRGWIDVETITLQGTSAPLTVTWTNDTTWTLQLPVSNGTKTYTLEARDKAGALATGAGGTGMASVEITVSGVTPPAGPDSLVISELNYNPAGSGDTTEFVELLNITAGTLDLAGCHFDDEAGQGIAYTFPAGVTIPAGGRLLVVRDTAAFTAAYPGAGPVAPGVYTGALDNAGESLVLYSAAGQVILRTEYPDSPQSTDGDGFSLVRVLSTTSPSAGGTEWRASTAQGGNPGASDALPFTGDPAADSDRDGLSALLEYAAGTSDTVFTTAPEILSFVIDGNGRAVCTWPTAPNADDAVLTLETSGDLGAWTTVSGDTVPAATRAFVRLKVSRR